MSVSDLLSAITGWLAAQRTWVLVLGGLGAFALLVFAILIILILVRRTPAPNSSFQMPASGAKALASSSEKLARRHAKTERAIRRAERAAKEGKPAPGQYTGLIIASVLVFLVAGIALGIAVTGTTPGALAAALRGNIGTPFPTRSSDAPEGQQLFERDGVRITVTEQERDSDRIKLALTIENRNVMHLEFSDLGFALNGCMTGSSLFDSSCTVASGDTVTKTVLIDSSALRECPPDSVRCIDMALRATNPDTHLTVFDTEMLEIQTELYDGTHDPLTGSTCYTLGSLTLNAQPSEEGSYRFSISNHSTDILSYSNEDMTVNGISMPGRDYDLAQYTVFPGCQHAFTITPTATFLRTNSISTIVELAWLLQVQSSGAAQSGAVVYKTGATQVEEATDTPVDRTLGDGITTSGGIGPFVDVERHAYYAEAVLWAYESGITGGTSAVTFSPDEPCSRGQMVSMLWRAMGSPGTEADPQENPYTDLTEASSCYAAVMWATELGIFSGTDETTFSPEQSITRGELIGMFWRLCGSPEPEDPEAQNSFKDVSDDYEQLNSVLWAVESGITTGTDAEHFTPDGVLNRAQAVTLLMRFFSYLG